jgi:peptidyl-prolyl cis-trans isomerase C
MHYRFDMETLGGFPCFPAFRLRRAKPGFAFATLLVASLALCACKPAPGPAKAPARSGPVLARVDDTEITASDLQDLLNRYAHTPFVAARYSTPEKKKELLDALVRYELLAREALRRGYDHDPDVLRIAKKQMVAQFEKREINDKLRPEDMAAAEIENYYREHASEFVRPEEVRVSQILVRDEAAARKLAAEAKARNTPEAFRALVERESLDQDSKPRAGDLLFFDRKTTRLPKPLVEAAFALAKPGDVAGPITSDKGFHIIRLNERRPEVTRTLAEAKPDIQRKLVEQMRTQRKRDLAEEARKTIRVEIYEDELAKVAVPTTPDAGRPDGRTAPKP